MSKQTKPETDAGPTSFLHIRAYPSDKAKWVRAASNVRPRTDLTGWVTHTLNQQAAKDTPEEALAPQSKTASKPHQRRATR